LTPPTDEDGAAAGLERSERWAGLRRGDEVRVTGTRMRAAHWTFLAHVRNTRSGDEWVEVVGGRHGDRAVRSFPPDQVFAPEQAGRGGDGPSLADAPRLPF
jgi:hypothetical protein